MNKEQKSLFKNLKQNRKEKTYYNLRNIHHSSECEIGNENRQMSEWIAEMSCYKKPKRQLPRDKDVFD